MMDYGALIRAVRDEVEELCGRLGCITAVAALIDVAAESGVVLRPLTVRAVVLNPFLTERVGDSGEAGFDGRLREWAEAPGSLRVGIGVGEVPAGEWAGHLVAVADLPDARKRLLLDATLEQANVPEEGIALRPSLLRVDIEHLRGSFRNRVNGCEILYKAFPEDLTFADTPAWRDHDGRREMRDRVIRRLADSPSD